MNGMADKQTASTLPYLNFEIILFLKRALLLQAETELSTWITSRILFCGRKGTKCSMSKLRKLLVLNNYWITIGYALCVVFMYLHHKNLNINRHDINCYMYRSVYSICDTNHAQNSSDTFFPVDCTHSFYSSKAVFPKLFFLLTDPFWLQKITMDPHILAYVGTVSRC